MRAGVQLFLIAALAPACGGNGGNASKTSASSDATVGGDVAAVIALADVERFKAFQSLTEAQPIEIDLKTFSYRLRLQEASKKSRRCESTLRVTANDKVSYETAAAAWQNSLGEVVSFKFEYSDFNAHSMEKISAAKVALKLDCRLLGELN